MITGSYFDNDGLRRKKNYKGRKSLATSIKVPLKCVRCEKYLQGARCEHKG